MYSDDPIRKTLDYVRGQRDELERLLKKEQKINQKLLEENKELKEKIAILSETPNY